MIRRLIAHDQPAFYFLRHPFSGYDILDYMIKVTDICKSYGKRKILDHVSFQAGCGEQIAIIGNNGCGKSTLMQILAGVSKPDSGQVAYFGHDAIRDRKLFTKYCGYVPQENPLMEELSVQDNISLWTGKSGKPEDKLIRMFELDSILKMPVEKLSGGMKRRVSIACAIAKWPPVILMDEPTSSLDIFYRGSIHKWMEEFRRMNGILVIATHDEEEMRTSSSCLMMKGGQLQQA